MSTTNKRVLLPLAAGLAGALLLTGLYFGIVSWAESPQHAAELFWEERWIVFPIILGFGVQAGLYTILKMRLFIPVATIGPSGLMIGAGTVIVKPLDLSSSQDKLSFEVTMDTHSIDLSMDLAALATLTTDNGQSVQAAVWDAPLGGHHVSETLSFPASVEGKAILDGASRLTLIIKDVDASERVFAWDLK